MRKERRRNVCIALSSSRYLAAIMRARKWRCSRVAANWMIREWRDKSSVAASSAVRAPRLRMARRALRRWRSARIASALSRSCSREGVGVRRRVDGGGEVGGSVSGGA